MKQLCIRRPKATESANYPLLPLLVMDEPGEGSFFTDSPFDETRVRTLSRSSWTEYYYVHGTGLDLKANYDAMKYLTGKGIKIIPEN